MSTVVVELYEALRKAGVDEALARSAASAVVPANALGELARKSDLSELRLATKSDLSELRLTTKSDLSELRLAVRADISDSKAELIKWNVGAMAILTAIFAAITRLT